MKKNLLLFIFLFFSCVSIYSQEIKKDPIPIGGGPNGELPNYDRPFTLEPSASHDNSSVYISTPVFTDGMKVEIYDENDNLVYTNVYGHTNNVVIDIAASGNYVLEITIGEDFFYGYFTIE